jgi:hypothetical protein
MSQYLSTTKRRYMWGIGVACSLLLLAIAGSWALEGRVGYRVSSFGSENAGEFRRDEAPVPFWLIVGCSLAVGAAGVAVTGVGLSRVQKQEADPDRQRTTRGM